MEKMERESYQYSEIMMQTKDTVVLIDVQTLKNMLILCSMKTRTLWNIGLEVILSAM